MWPFQIPGRFSRFVKNRPKASPMAPELSVFLSAYAKVKKGRDIKQYKIFNSNRQRTGKDSY